MILLLDIPPNEINTCILAMSLRCIVGFMQDLTTIQWIMIHGLFVIYVMGWTMKRSGGATLELKDQAD